MACITESHLIPSISSSFVDIPHFSLIRHDVAGSVQKHGTCVYVHESILVDSVNRPLPNVLLFRLAELNVHVVVVYRPPSNIPLANQQLASFLSEYCIDKEVLVLGDFNLPNIRWQDQCEAKNSNCPSLDTMFLDTFDSLGLTQWVTEPTFPRSGNTLDLVLTSEQDRISSIRVEPPLPGCDHCPVVFHYVFQVDAPHLNDGQRPGGAEHRAWHKGKYSLIMRHLLNTDWDLEFKYRNTSECVSHFTRIVSDLAHQFVPVNKARESGIPWKTRPPTGLVRQRQLAWQKYKSVRHQLGRSASDTHSAYAKFTSVNRQYRSFSVRAQANYESGLIDRSKENPKLLHSYIRNKKVGRPSVGPLTLDSGELSDAPAAMAECFASSFSAVYSNDCPVNPAPYQTSDIEIDNIDITTDSVKAALLALDGNSAMGPDGIHPYFLKSCATELAYPLCVIFRRSLREGIVPCDWKSSTVVPIFKKGIRSNPLNYRPVSLTSVCCKTLERLIAQHLTSFLEENVLLDENQFGFRSGRSTMEQLLLVYSEVSKITDEGGVADVILFDYSKAFDVVNHSILISKLHCLGIRGNVLDWVSSFLSDRKMSVSVMGSSSRPRRVISGVPQGSVLGPLLFLIYVNNIASDLTCRYKVFADDLKIYACVHRRSVPGHSLSMTNVQADINMLYKTSLSWGLKMNPDKCAVLRFSRVFSGLTPAEYFMNGVLIPPVKSHVDLGVIVDTDLKFHGHIRSAVRKAGGLAQNFLKSTVCREPDFMLFLLITHIRPIIEYCSCVWNTGYQGDLRLLESVQRRWTKQISSVNSLEYADRLRTLKLFSVKGRLLRADLIQCWKIFHGVSCIDVSDIFLLTPRRGTRGHCYKIFTPTVQTDVRKRFFNVRCVSVWNSLPQYVVSASSLSSFKKLLENSLGDVLFEYVD